MKLDSKRCSISAIVKDRISSPRENLDCFLWAGILFAFLGGCLVTPRYAIRVSVVESDQTAPILWGLIMRSLSFWNSSENERTSTIRLSNDADGGSCHFSISQRVIISLFIGCLYLTICALFVSSGRYPNL